MRVSLEDREGAPDETKRDHDESAKRMAAPKQLEHLRDA